MTRHTPFPPRGPAGPVPPLHWYYQGAKTPWTHPAALRFLRLAVPRLRPTLCSHRVRTPCICGPGLFGHPGPNRGSTAEISGLSQVPGRTPLCACPGLIPRGTLDARPYPAPKMLPSVHPKTSAPRTSSLSRLDYHGLHTRCLRFAAWVTPTTPRKTRFRWVANPCRVGFGPTGSTTKGFRSCLLHFPSSLPRLGLARGASLRQCRGNGDRARSIGPCASSGPPRRPGPG